jgi:GT2 family glycosyltransferase
MTPPFVGVIILNWNNSEDTICCLDSVYKSTYQSFEAIVVDNASRDDSVVRIRESFPNVTILVNQENLGYVGGNNVGIEYAVQWGADYVLILNDDTVVAPDMISNLVSTAEIEQNAGILGPKVYTLEQPNVLLSTGAYLKSGSEIYTPALGTVDHGQWDQQPDPGYLSGCAVLVKRKVMDEVGMLDPKFFAYQEDIDWCYRIREAGYRCVLVPGAKCWHPDTRTGRENSPLVTYYMSRNHLLFVIKHKLGLVELIRSIGVFVRRILSWSLRPKWQYKRPQRDALVRALIDFLMGRFGKAKGFG